MPSKKVALMLFLGWMFQTSIYSQSLYLAAKGITDKETQTIDSIYYQKSFNDFLSLQAEVELIHTKLTSDGYIENELLELAKENDSTYLASFDLKLKYKWIRLYFDHSINRKILKLIATDIKENYVDIELADLEASLKLLNSEFSNEGDPFSTLQLTKIKKQGNDNLYADLVISENFQRRIIDSIVVKGYEKFPKSFIKHYLKIKANQPFNLKTIKEKTADMENLAFANQIKEPEVLFTKDSTLLYIYVEKQKSNAFDGFLGFGTNTETNKIEFNGYLNLNLLNNLNFGESFRLIYKSDESEQKTFDVNAELPYLFNSPLGVDLSLNIFKKDSSFVTISQSAKLQYQINPKNLLSAGIDSSTSTNLLDNTSFLIDDYQSTFYTLNYIYTKRQRFDRLFPINFQFDFYTGFGSRTFENSDTSQTKLGLETQKNFYLNEKNSIFLRITGATLISDSYFLNELFRFGGINSIRGFEENSLTAHLYSVLNTEYRYKVSNSLYVHSVIDASYFENDLLETKGKLFGFGFGFGILTKSGLFKFNYSNGKTENQPFKLSDSKIHLSLTASF
ncbi:MAG: POTRA domain-containing protein [Aquaticitalea sp.]